MKRRQDRFSAAAKAEKRDANSVDQPDLLLPDPFSLPPDAPQWWERLELPSTFKRPMNVAISEATTRKVEYLAAKWKIPKCQLVDWALDEWATEKLRRLGIPHGQAVPIHF